jgi:hypothetical protein
MSEMGSHDPFGHLKHKLWPKEGLGVKLAIWLPTTKSRELPWYPCVQVVYDILLESFWQGLQLCFDPHLNWRSVDKIMGPQSRKSPNFENLGVSGQNAIWMLVLWLAIKYIIRGKVMAFPKSGPWWVLWIRVYPWLILAPKRFQLCTNQLIIWFMQVHVND